MHYGTSLANVDWLHGSAESLLTVTNLLIGGQGPSLYFITFKFKGGCGKQGVLGAQHNKPKTVGTLFTPFSRLGLGLVHSQKGLICNSSL